MEVQAAYETLFGNGPSAPATSALRDLSEVVNLIGGESATHMGGDAAPFTVASNVSEQ